MLLNVFAPADTLAVSASTTSATATFGAGAQFQQVRVYNSTAAIAFVRWGNGAQTAVTTDTPVAPGTVEIFNKGFTNSVAVILSAGTGTVYFTAGEGQ